MVLLVVFWWRFLYKVWIWKTMNLGIMRFSVGYENDWIGLIDWIDALVVFWETNMERAYHTSKTLKVNYVHHASFWWNHYIILMNRPKKLSQVSSRSNRCYWPIIVQATDVGVGELKLSTWFFDVGDRFTWQNIFVTNHQNLYARI